MTEISFACDVKHQFNQSNSSVPVSSAVEILQSFVRHRSDRIRDFVRPNKILSDRTFFHKAYNFDHIIILGNDICIYCSKTNGQSDSSKIQCYCSSGTCHVVVPAKAKHDVEMDRQTDDGRNESLL